MVTAQARTQVTPTRRTKRAYKPRSRHCAYVLCKKVFTPKTTRGRYCCDNHRKADHRAKAAKANKRHSDTPELELTTCLHCKNTFLKVSGKDARFCSPRHRTAAARLRRARAVEAVARDRSITIESAEQAVKRGGMKKVTQYLHSRGYLYDSWARVWIVPGKGLGGAAD